MSPTTMRLTREEATFVIDYSKYLNDRARVIKPSGIRRFFDIANEMEDVISLSIGEPDFFPVAYPRGGYHDAGKGQNALHPEPRPDGAARGDLPLFKAQI